MVFLGGFQCSIDLILTFQTSKLVLIIKHVKICATDVIEHVIPQTLYLSYGYHSI